MYTYLVQFIVESRGVSVESQLIKIFLSKINKRLLDLATLRIIFNYNGKAILTQIFVEIKKYIKVLCQYDTIDIVAYIMDVSKSKKIISATSSLVEIQPKRTIHY